MFSVPSVVEDLRRRGFGFGFFQLIVVGQNGFGVVNGGDEISSRADESAAQADILRQYFSAREVGDLFRQAPA